MSTLRRAWLSGALLALTACAGTSGSVGEAASDNEAAIANMNLGAGYLRQGNVELAIERLRRALAQDPDLVQAHSTIAFAYDQIGSLEEAETHFRRATELDREDGAAANAYAAFLCNRGNRWAEAEPYFRRATQDLDYGTPEVAMTNAGICARDAGELQKAEENFRAALTRNPRYADALLNMIELSFQREDHLQTRAFTQRYLAIRPATASVLWMCYSAERALNNAPAAEACATQLRSGFPSSPELAQLNEQQRGNGR
jgi:type IV pilus assembly protein PilF